MNIEYFSFDKVPYLSSRDIKFQIDQEFFSDFLNKTCSLENFKDVIKEKSSSKVDRSLLVKAIHEQYDNAGIKDYPKSQVDKLLRDNVFTVVTAHQPSLLTGPLYYVYKIISVINLAKKLTEEYSDIEVVPVFIIGSEDHDFEEINHFKLFGRTIQWENDEGGAVGRMSTDSLYPVLDEVYEILGESDNALKLKNIIKEAFKNVDNYNTGVFRLVHSLFSKHNVVLLVADNKNLKSAFIPHMKKEILEQISQPIIQETQKKLEELGIKSQAHAREINFFYLQKGRRDRIVLEKGIYKVLDTDVTFSESELIREIEEFPERFSPNVAMRPIYQETILPNLAYLGGGGELAYWTERKDQFEAFGVTFPILVRRNSILWITSGDQKLLDKYQIRRDDLFEDKEEWVKMFLKNNADAELNFEKEFNFFNEAYDGLANKANKIDASLAKAIKANQTKQFKVFEQLSSRLIRVEKEKNERDVNKIKKLNEKLFPSGGLQERKENFIPFYLKYGDEFFEVLKENLDPFNQSFVVISEA